jgi:hypothetical protein
VVDDRGGNMPGYQAPDGEQEGVEGTGRADDVPGNDIPGLSERREHLIECAREDRGFLIGDISQPCAVTAVR